MNGDAGTTQITTPFDSAERDLEILVGFDGSDHALSALHFAAVEAMSRNVGLTVVTAFTVPVMIYPNMASLPAKPEDEFRQEIAEKTLDAAREYLKEYAGKVSFATVQGDATGALVDLSTRAKLVVVGARGRGGFLGRILGSVASALPAHAHCPTIVVPSDYEPGQAEGVKRFTSSQSDSPVLAAIDGSDKSHLVLLAAAQQAEHRGAPLKVFAAMPLLGEWMYWYPEIHADEGSIEKRRAHLQQSIDEGLAWLRDDHHSLDITLEVTVGDPIALIEDKTRASALTVVGTRGRGAVRSALLGSISRGVLNHAEGPVMVVPTAADDDSREQ